MAQTRWRWESAYTESPAGARKRVCRCDADESSPAIADDHDATGNPILLVNGFGGTPSTELDLWSSPRRYIEAHGIKAGRSLVGTYVTSLEMAGCSITVSLLDRQSTECWDAPVHTAGLRWGI